MKHSILIILGCINSYLSYAQCFHGEYTTEWQWDMKKETNWVNLLKLNLSVPVWNRMGSFEATTIHVAKTNECIIDDWQTFSNIEEENELAAIAVLGYMHEWKECHLFVGIRNVYEDFFTSDVTSLFTNSSCGIFPTISEYSLEVTWKRHLNNSLAMQPSFHYISNGKGNFMVVSARLYCIF